MLPKRFAFLIQIAIVSCLVAACSHGRFASKGESVSSGLSFADAWERSLNVLHFKGYPVKHADRDSGVILTERKVMLLGEMQADCPEFHRFPYIENKRTIKYVSQKIVIGKGDRVRIGVSADIAGQPDNVVEGKGKDKPLPPCASRCTLERELLAEIVSPGAPR